MENKINSTVAENTKEINHYSKNDLMKINKSNILINSNESKNSLIRNKSKENIAKKYIRMKDLDLLNTNNKSLEQEDIDFLKNKLNEPIYLKTEPSNFDNYTLKTSSKRLNNISKNKSRKNLNFFTKEKKIVNIIQHHDQIFSANLEDFNNKTYINFLNDNPQNQDFNKTKNSKLQSMKNYNSNMDYYKYKEEINKKHIINAEFNIKKQSEFLVNLKNNFNNQIIKSENESLDNISNLLKINTKSKLEEINDIKNKYYGELIDNCKQYDRAEDEKIEDYVYKNNLLKRNKKIIDTELINYEIKEKQNKEFRENYIENKLRLENKKPTDYKSMLSKKGDSGKNYNTNRSFQTINNDYVDNAYNERPFYDKNLVELNLNSKNDVENKFKSDSHLTKINNEADCLKNNYDESNVFYKNAQIEINYKLDKQRKEIHNMFYLSRKTNLNTEVDPALAYKNIYNLNRTITNKKDINIKSNNNNSFEKFNDYLKKKDKFNRAITFNETEKKIDKEIIEFDINLPSIENQTISNKKEPNKIIEKRIHKLENQKKPSFEINDSDKKEEFEQEDLSNIRSNKKLEKIYSSKKNILEVDSIKVYDNNKANFENNENALNFGRRYINPMNNNIYSIADIEILDKKSNVTKLMKPFSQDIKNISSEINSQKKIKLALKEEYLKQINEINQKEDSNKHLNLKIFKRNNTLKTDTVSNYYNQTCPTEITYLDTICSSDKNKNYNLEKIYKVKKLEEKINMGKMKKLNQLKNDISIGFNNMVNLEEKIKNSVIDSTHDFKNKLNKLQEKYYSSYKNEWKDKNQ